MSSITTSLLTDRYELTMLQAALGSGVATHRAVFEVFARSLPPGRRFGVFCGTGRVLDSLDRFHFGDPELDYLRQERVINEPTLSFLKGFRFSGSIHSYEEGDLYFPGSPVMTVESTFGEATLMETLILSILNFDTAVASAASRMRIAAGNRTLVEMGSRRAHEWAAPAAARSAYIAGFDSTSNLEAGRLYAIPTAGTVAHSFILAHGSESTAFEALTKAFGPRTTILVDTFDTEEGIRKAIASAGNDLAGIRLDSGDLGHLSSVARKILDGLGARRTQILASGDLDEWSIEKLRDAPIDGYGVGTSLVTGSGAPTAGFIYKLVAVAESDGPSAPLRPVAKTSVGKATSGGRKWSYRLIAPNGKASAEVLCFAPAEKDRPLQQEVMVSGRRVAGKDLDQTRAHHRRCLEELEDQQLSLTPGPPAMTATCERNW